MKSKRSVAALVAALTLTSAIPALAAPAQVAQTAQPPVRRARASLRIDAGPNDPWVGQPVAVTITAFFRGLEGVTLEAGPQLDSKAIITSDIQREPRQTTELIDGERTLVVRWSAKVTPSRAGPLDLSVSLPVRIRYREAAPASVARPERQDPFGGDPFSDLDIGSADAFDALFDRMRSRMQNMQRPALGPVQEQAIPLKASTKALQVRALPADDRPATFSGAVGHFDIDASVSSARVSASEPVTLRIAVGGSVDLDRVDLPGVASSDTWKAYPPRVVEAPASAKGAPQKIFQQVIVPLHGGDLTVPPVSFTAFDPATGTYVTRSTQPMVVAVSGSAAAPAAPSPAVATPAPAADIAPSPADVVNEEGPVPVLSPLQVGLRVLPVLALVLAAGVARVVQRRRREWSLRRDMRRAASGGDVSSFLGSAHELIAKRLSDRWGVPPEQVTATKVQERLGPDARPLADALVAYETLRFARGGTAGADPATRRRELSALRSSIEQSLRGAI